MPDEPDDGADESEIWALIRRELIAEANRQDWTAVSVRKLLIFAQARYDRYILGHPTFPKGVLSAYLAEGGK